MIKFQKFQTICTYMYFPFVIIFTVFISLSSSDSVFTVIEGEDVFLEFPYPTDSIKVTLQRANGAPFYSSIASVNRLDRFHVENINCSLNVEINPVMRDDEATYICQAYREGVALSELIRKRLNVEYPPGKLSCVESNEPFLREWISLQCTVSAGSLAGQIQCFQDAMALPPLNRLVQTDGKLRQTFLVIHTYKHPVFCCSSLLDQPKDICDCKDFVWDNNQTDGIKQVDPCHVTTQGLVTELTEYHRNNTEKNSQLTPFNVALITETNKNNGMKITSPVLFGVSIITNAILVMVLVYCHVQKTKITCKQISSEKHNEPHVQMKVDESKEASKKPEPQETVYIM